MIVGYSINDTIVVFDRIREELEMNPVTNLRKIITIAINRVLSRSIITSVTTLLAAVSLWVFSAGVINDFAFIFVIGILTGTFSSVFIASPIFFLWHKGDRKYVEEGEMLPKYDWHTSTTKGLNQDLKHRISSGIIHSRPMLWIEKEIDDEKIDAFSRSLSISSLLAQLLLIRE